MKVLFIIKIIVSLRVDLTCLSNNKQQRKTAHNKIKRGRMDLMDRTMENLGLCETIVKFDLLFYFILFYFC